MQSWSQTPLHDDKARSITAKFKILRKNLREWQASLTNLRTTISSVRLVILFLDVLADFRDLSLPEWNFRKMLEGYHLNLLEKQKIY